MPLLAVGALGLEFGGLVRERDGAAAVDRACPDADALELVLARVLLVGGSHLNFVDVVILAVEEDLLFGLAAVLSAGVKLALSGAHLVEVIGVGLDAAGVVTILPERDALDAKPRAIVHGRLLIRVTRNRRGMCAARELHFGVGREGRRGNDRDGEQGDDIFDANGHMRSWQ